MDNPKPGSTPEGNGEKPSFPATALAMLRRRYFLLCAVLLGGWFVLCTALVYSPVWLLHDRALPSHIGLTLGLAIGFALFFMCGFNEGAQQEKWRNENNAITANPADFPLTSELSSLAKSLALKEPGLFIVPSGAPTLQIFSPVKKETQTRMMVSTGFLETSKYMGDKPRRASISHELAHVYLRSGFWDALADAAVFPAYVAAATLGLVLSVYWGQNLAVGMLLALMLGAIAHLVNQALRAWLSRIHEYGADDAADIIAGPGAIASSLVLHISWYNRRGYKSKRLVPEKLRHWPRFLYRTAMADHPHDLKRIERSKKRLNTA